MERYQVTYTKQAKKDIEKLRQAKLLNKAKKLIDVISENPYQNPPSYEKLVGDLKGVLSRRINIKHRLIYKVYEEEMTIKIIRMWTHYE